jgi:histidinol-phosphatase
MSEGSSERESAVAFARSLAELADGITMKHFRSRSLVVETKPDLTEVTIADRATEKAIADAILEGRPGDGIVGEEHGDVASTNGSRWIVDPIDGTSNYTRGLPIWATLIARESEGVLDVGVVSCPALGLQWWAAKEVGAFSGNRRLRVSNVADLDHTFLSYTESPEWTLKRRRDGIDRLRKKVGRERAFGDFWQHMMVAEGQIDIAAEAVVSFWDLAAIQVIVEEAGGIFSDLDGAKRADGGSALSTNGRLHALALAELAPPPSA